jgi:hypothetical protein
VRRNPNANRFRYDVCRLAGIALHSNSYQGREDKKRMGGIVWLNDEDIESIDGAELGCLEAVVASLHGDGVEIHDDIQLDDEIWDGCELIHVIGAIAEGEAERRKNQRD